MPVVPFFGLGLSSGSGSGSARGRDSVFGLEPRSGTFTGLGLGTGDFEGRALGLGVAVAGDGLAGSGRAGCRLGPLGDSRLPKSPEPARMGARRAGDLGTGGASASSAVAPPDVDMRCETAPGAKRSVRRCSSSAMSALLGSAEMVLPLWVRREDSVVSWRASHASCAGRALSWFCRRSSISSSCTRKRAIRAFSAWITSPGAMALSCRERCWDFGRRAAPARRSELQQLQAVAPTRSGKTGMQV
jgi:hypothetical protein